MFIAKYFKTKSLLFTSSLVLSLIFTVVLGSSVWLSYNQQRQAYLNEFEQYGQSLSAQIKANSASLTTAHDMIATKQGSGDAAFSILKMQLDAMAESTSIANSYVFMPDKIEKDGKTFLLNIQENQSLTDLGLLPGTEYELNSYFLEGYEEAMRDGWAVTDSYSDSMGDWISYLAPIRDKNGEIIALFGLDFDYGTVKKELSFMLWTNLGGGFAFILISILIVVSLIRIAVRPLRKLAELSKLASQGDLTVSIPITNGNEIGQAAESFNMMIASLRDLTRSIRTTSAEVSESASNLQESAKQTAEATQEIAEAIQSVAAGSDTQLQSSKECQRAMIEMATGIQRIAESSSVVSDLAADTTTSASAGESVIASTVNQMQTIEHNLSSSVETIHELKELSGRIGEIMALIADVANQTNLLALNASIEAARAGEHGKGFAVVAQEIRKLAERSRESSEQIESILQGIGTRTTQAVSSLEQSMTEARTGTSVAHQAGDTFRTIVHAIRQVSEQVQEVSAASQQMSAGSEQIAASLEELERIASVSSQDSENVAASSEEQLAAMEEVASSSEQLRELANSLNRTIERFKV
ncbi:methyl-accepting chemotaxis protein [Paenibacillus mendelii]|uniref:Methyl-accepting chemotaxis protein n=1 Tax=Paenibacillus mendelii TaxID=206163 RepID=A0ABV6JAZ1_9BACL|nr:methyl-accepting chemotaxis protein [Paenibacillus mendelii]MCQ6562925.1 methyl-accepting chemotaxis protein [Paenibacillus mendelii]